MYYQGEMEKKERRKIIIIAGILVAIILILLAAVIMVANKKSAKSEVVNTNPNSAIQIADNDTDKTDAGSSAQSDKSTSSSTGNLSTKVEDDSSSEKKVSVDAVAATTSSMPNTGPEDFIPFVLIGGTTVAYLLSRTLAKRDA